MPNYGDLLESINELTDVLVQHAKYLEMHNGTMESLAEAVKQLENTFNQMGNPETDQPSHKLKHALTNFVETYINPRYYQPHKMLNSD